MDSNLNEGASGRIFMFARDLRKSETPAEKILWKHLRGRKFNGFKFRRQHPIQNYIADFYCHECRLAIEVDGDIHSLQGQKAYDEQRTFELGLYEIRVIRFRNEELVEDLDSVLRRIAVELTPHS